MDYLGILNKEEMGSKDLSVLGGIFAFSFYMFWMIYYISSKLSQCSNEYFRKLDNKKKADYTSRVVANIHAIIACIISYVTFFHTCEDGKNIFSSDECLMNPSKFQSYGAILSAGYLCYDFFVCLLLIREKSAIQTQTYIHHIVGIIGTIGCIFAGKMNTPICVISLITELSTPFLNLRAIMLSQQKGSTFLFKANLVAFLLAFLICRVLFYPFMIWRLFIGFTLLDHKTFTQFKFVLSCILTFFYVGMYFLQIFWFYKILLGAYNTLTNKYGNKRPTKRD